MICVGDQLILKANPVLGSVAEKVEVCEVLNDHVVVVKQLTSANGEPGWFEVDVDQLEGII